MAANNIYIQVDLNSQSAQQNVNALNQAIGQTGEEAEKSSKKTTKAFTGVQLSINQTTKAFGELTTALAGLGVGRMISSMVQVGSEINRAQLFMAAFAGSAQEGAKAFEQIRAVAQQSTFGFKDLEEAGRSLMGFGMAAKDVPATIKTVTDQVTAMGGSIENVNAIIRVFGRVMDRDFVGAMDLMRLLPQQGVKVTEALRDAMSKQLGTAVSKDQMQKFIKEGVLDPLETVRTILNQMQSQTGGAGAKVNDAAKAFKNLGDEAWHAAQLLAGDKGFGPALTHLADQIQILLAPLAGLVVELNKLPESTKERIVDIAALTAACTGLAAALTFLTPELILFAAAVAGLGVAFSKLETVKLKDLFATDNPLDKWVMGKLGMGAGKEDANKTVGDWFTGILESIKKKLGDLGKEGAALIGDMQKEIADAMKQGAPTGPTKPLVENSQKSLDDLNKQLQEWATGANRTLLQALSSPAEAVAVKYKELFDKLEDMLRDKVITGAEADKARQSLTGSQATETQARVFEEQKKHISELAKLDEERVKGSYEAQIAYIEALDAKDLQGKVAAIDRITALRIESAQKVAQVQDNELQQLFEAQKALLESHRAEFEAAGVDVNKAIADRQKEMVDKQKVIDQKMTDDKMKYELEGWKKANDAIIEDQKRIFDAFKGEFDQLFDAMTGKAPGKAVGEFFRKFAMDQAKDIFSSTAATAATSAAGYGVPTPEITRGGILGQLLRRGMPPRPPMAPPDIYNPARGVAGVSYDGGTNTANRMMVSADTIYNASIVFAQGARQIAAAASSTSSKGYAERRMTDAQLTGPEPHITLGPTRTGARPTVYPIVRPEDFPTFTSTVEPPAVSVPWSTGGGGYSLPTEWSFPNISAPGGGGGGAAPSFGGFGTGTVAGVPGGFTLPTSWAIPNIAPPGAGPVSTSNLRNLVAWAQKLRGSFGIGTAHQVIGPPGPGGAMGGTYGTTFGSVMNSPAAKAGAGMVGSMLFQAGVFGNAQGTALGLGESTFGGAGVGFAMGGPLGAAIGAAAGFGIGLGEMIAGVESPRNKAKRLASQLYHININNATADSIAALAQQSYGGNVGVAMRSPQVRQMLGLYAAGTGQANQFSQGVDVAHGASLVESGGSLFQQATYQYGNPYTYGSNLPVYGGPGPTHILGAPGGGMTLSLNIDGSSAAKFLQGNVVSPDVVQTQYATAMQNSNGRVDQALMMTSPGMISGTVAG